jgi:iron complex outermembrane receptor protein
MSEVFRSYCRNTLVRCGVLAALAAPIVPAWADSAVVDSTADAAASSQSLEEVNVTAERRDNDIQKTPLAISVVSAATLDKANINDLTGLNGTVPGLEINKSSGFETVVTIRGIGSETPENAPTTTPGVAFFVDGVYIANTVSLDQTLFDVDHVEVLRGPQGALYGESAIGGAISVVSKQPELGKFGVSGDFTAGDYGLLRERVAVNLPVSDTLAVRFSFQKYDHNGFTKDTALPGHDLDDAHDWSAKVAVLWKPTDNFSATATAQLYQADQHGAAQKNIDDPNPDPRVVTQDYPAEFKLDTSLYHLNLEWNLPLFTIKSVTAYQGLDHHQQEDSSRSAISLLGSYDDVAAWNTNLHNYNEELDFLSLPNSRFEWIGGLFLLKQTSTQFVAEFEGTGVNPDLAITPDLTTEPPSNLDYGNITKVTRKSWAPFLQGTYHLADDLRLTVGARYNHDAYSLNSYNFSAFAIDDVSNGYSDSATTGRVEMDYDLQPSNLLYVSVARGYKPGGVNGIASAVVVPETFKLETNNAVEVGSKNLLLDNKLRVNVAAFFYVYKDMQYIETDPVPFDGGMSNIPSVHAWGGEFETSYLAFQDRFRINANLTLEDSAVQGTYKTIDSTVQNTIEGSAAPCAYGGAYYNAGCWAAVIAASRNIGGSHLPDMPRASGSVDASYAIPLPIGTITPRIEYIYRGAEWARVFNEPALDRIGGYGIVNLNATYVPTIGHFSLSLIATNVANIAGVNSRYTDPYGTGQTSQQYIPPRQIMGTIGFSF